MTAIEEFPPVVELVLAREGSPMNYLMAGMNGQANEAFKAIEHAIIGGITYVNYIDGKFIPVRASQQIDADLKNHEESVFWGISMGMTVGTFLGIRLKKIIAINPCPHRRVLKSAFHRLGLRLGVAIGTNIGLGKIRDGAGYDKTTQLDQARAIDVAPRTPFYGVWRWDRIFVVISEKDDLLSEKQVRKLYSGATFAVAKGARHASINTYPEAYLGALRELGVGVVSDLPPKEITYHM